jgi:hypothetical protein
MNIKCTLLSACSTSKFTRVAKMHWFRHSWFKCSPELNPVSTVLPGKALQNKLFNTIMPYGAVSACDGVRVALPVIHNSERGSLAESVSLQMNKHDFGKPLALVLYGVVHKYQRSEGLLLLRLACGSHVAAD